MDINVVKEAINKYYEDTKYYLQITYNNIFNTKTYSSGFEISICYDSLKIVTPDKKEIYYYDISNIIRIMLIRV